jgi:hypothetical protein
MIWVGWLPLCSPVGGVSKSWASDVHMHCGVWPSRPLPLKYEIVAVGQSGVHEAADRLLAHAHGDRRMLRQAGAQLRHAGVEVAGSTISLTKPAARPASLAVVIAVVLEFLIEWCRSGSK